eukprot:TRINITY_DN19127_c0_g1_i1.p1 TRINITY_DN19127_c0_g1~~TRINITY_DN19127_c0_g1_i1.p1  ORF type:complete len:117 (+),score=27.65 TRINITY_DN19127_c0_g1_i1:114-464(+)
MIRRPPRSTLSSSSAASDVYKRQVRYMMKGYSFSNSDVWVILQNLRWQYGCHSSLRCGRLQMTHHQRQRIACRKCTALHLSLIHISEPTRLLSISYAVFCLKKKKKKRRQLNTTDT